MDLDGTDMNDIPFGAGPFGFSDLPSWDEDPSGSPPPPPRALVAEAHDARIYGSDPLAALAQGQLQIDQQLLLQVSDAPRSRPGSRPTSRPASALDHHPRPLSSLDRPSPHQLQALMVPSPKFSNGSSLSPGTVDPMFKHESPSNGAFLGADLQASSQPIFPSPLHAQAVMHMNMQHGLSPNHGQAMASSGVSPQHAAAVQAMNLQARPPLGHLPPLSHAQLTLPPIGHPQLPASLPLSLAPLPTPPLQPAAPGTPAMDPILALHHQQQVLMQQQHALAMQLQAQGGLGQQGPLQTQLQMQQQMLQQLFAQQHALLQHQMYMQSQGMMQPPAHAGSTVPQLPMSLSQHDSAMAGHVQERAPTPTSNGNKLVPLMQAFKPSASPTPMVSGAWVPSYVLPDIDQTRKHCNGLYVNYSMTHDTTFPDRR